MTSETRIEPVAGSPDAGPLRPSSVVGLAYDATRELIMSGALAPGARIGQAEVAERLGISRGPVREALRRLVGDGLVEFEVNRGFFVADISLDVVLERLEARLLLEPQIARLAADRRTADDLDALRRSVEDEAGAITAEDAHDASRAFHLAAARASGNRELVQVLDSLWIFEIGRRLLAARRAVPSWQAQDVEEHARILEAIERSDGAAAEALMRDHIAAALRHWQAAVG